VVLVQRFDPSTALDTIRERGVTVIPGAPPMWVAWSQFAEAPADAFAGVRLALSGAAKMPEDATRALRSRFGLQLREGYGLTEASPVVTSSVDGDPPVGSVGTVLPGIEVRLVDEGGDDVLKGDSGELWVRGPNVFAGYWEEPEVSAAVLTADGWLRTGDIAVVDEGGYLFIVDRAKDMVITGGFNVYSIEVEQALMAHPAVQDCAVLGLPDEKWGERVTAVVQLKTGQRAEPDELKAFVKQRLGSVKAPKQVELWADLPRSKVAKVLKKEIRAQLLEKG